MPKVDCNCIYCNKPFQVFPSQIKKGQGKFCSVSCNTTFRNLTDNPSWRPEVREKISKNHAPVPWLIEYNQKKWANQLTGNYRVKACKVYGKKCNRCGSVENIQVHHKDRNRKNDDINNLEVLCHTCHVQEHLEEKRKVPRCPKTGRFLRKGDAV